MSELASCKNSRPVRDQYFSRSRAPPEMERVSPLRRGSPDTLCVNSQGITVSVRPVSARRDQYKSRNGTCLPAVPKVNARLVRSLPGNSVRYVTRARLPPGDRSKTLKFLQVQKRNVSPRCTEGKRTACAFTWSSPADGLRPFARELRAARYHSPGIDIS